MIEATLTMTDVLDTYRRAALLIRDLQRKGVPCHIEQKDGEGGPFLAIVGGRPPFAAGMNPLPPSPPLAPLG